MNYTIYQDAHTQKYGIRDADIDVTVVKCIFDNIEVYKNSNLVKFTLDGMQAIYKIEDIIGLSRQ
jgi:hypothetical protein